MYKILKTVSAVFTILILSVQHSSAQTLGDSCVDYNVADKNVAIVKKVAESVKLVAKTASEACEIGEMVDPVNAEAFEAAALAFELAEATAEVVAEIAEAYGGHPYGSPEIINIPWNNIESGDSLKSSTLTLSDGDTILMRRKAGGTGKFTFEQVNLTWWKGIVAFPKDDVTKWYEIVCLQDDRKACTFTLNPALSQTHYITLSKAKTAGVHTNMYLIENWGAAPTDYDYQFSWMRD